MVLSCYKEAGDRGVKMEIVRVSRPAFSSEAIAFILSLIFVLGFCDRLFCFVIG